MSSAWSRFEAWLAEHWSEGRAALNPPATEEQLVQLEKTLGLKLPQDYMDCLKVHNGQNLDVGGLFDGSHFLSTDDILIHWARWKNLLDAGKFEGKKSDSASGVQRDWWNPRWIPFAYNDYGGYLCLDLAPDDSGRPGQIITMWPDTSERTLEASSFRDWFRAYTKRVFSGDFVFSDTYGALINRAGY